MSQPMSRSASNSGRAATAAARRCRKAPLAVPSAFCSPGLARAREAFCLKAGEVICTAALLAPGNVAKRPGCRHRAAMVLPWRGGGMVWSYRSREPWHALCVIAGGPPRRGGTGVAATGRSGIKIEDEACEELGDKRFDAGRPG